MKITKIYIAAFGGLKDYTLELDKGLNVILGENENGKSTVMAFIKMMFYGSGRRSNDLNKNPRMKYKPWSGDTMGGRIYFEHGGRRYCLEREFKNNDSADRTALRDLDLGASVPIAAAELGKHFFGLSDAAFERSVFISGTGVFSADSESSGELNARLSNTVTTGDEETSYQLIKKRIQSALGELITAKHVGKYDKGTARLEELKAEYQKAYAAAKVREELGEKIKLLKKQLIDTKAEYDRVKEIIDSENDIRNTEKLREYLDTKKQLDELNDTLLLSDGGHIDSLFIGKVNFCLSKFDNECRRVSEKQTEITELEATLRTAEENRSKADPERLQALQSQMIIPQSAREGLPERYSALNERLSQAQQAHKEALSKRRAFNPLLLISGIILIITAAVLFAFDKTVPTIAAASVGAATAVLGFIVRPLDKSAAVEAMSLLTELQQEMIELKNEETAIAKRISELTSEIDIITAALNTDTAMLERQKAELDAQNATLEKLRGQRQAAWAELTDIFSRFKAADDPEYIRSQLDGLTERTEEQKSLKLRLKYLSSDLGNISYETAAEKLAVLNSSTSTEKVDFEGKKAELKALNERGISLSTELSAAMTELKSELRHAVDPESVMHEITELSARLEEQKRFIDAARLSSEVLEDSYAELHSSYGSALEKRTLEIFSKLTGGRYSGINISDSMGMEAEASGIFGTRSIEYLSSGTVDQAYLSLRLALCELITEGERLPIMLDDALSQYDDTRAETALSFLKEYSQDTQTVLFTCHNTIYNIADRLGAAVCKFNQ